MSYCQSQTAVKSQGDTRTIVSLRCRAWTCPDCAPDRKRALIAQGIGGNPSLFLTLTHRRTVGVSPEQAAKRLSYAFRLLRLRIMRKYKMRKLPFLAVVEAHKSGYPHLHILLRSKFIDWFYIRDVMAELIDSPRINIKRATNKAGVAAYCAKYCTKCAVKFGTAKRYWQSRDYDLRERDPDDERRKGQGGWSVFPDSLEKWREYAIQLGYRWRQPSAYLLILDEKWEPDG